MADLTQVDGAGQQTGYHLTCGVCGAATQLSLSNPTDDPTHCPVCGSAHAVRVVEVSNG